MGLPLASGHPNYSAGGTSEFIPEIWSGKLLTKLYAKQVLAAISNTDYEGEIKDYGDKVKIRTIPTVSIRDYHKGMDLQYEKLESPSTYLAIDKGKYFAFIVDDVDLYQSDLKLIDKWSTAASEDMGNAIDKQVLAAIKADVHAKNKGATAGAISGDINLGATGAPLQIDKTNVIDFIVDCGVVLGEQNVPKEGCWMVVPEWFGGMISKSDLKDASMTGDGKSVLRNGRIGVIWPFEIFLSNNLPSVADGGFTAYDVIFGHKMGLTFASQIVKTESLRAPTTFGDLVRGLDVYGFRVILPEAIGCGYVRK